MRREIFKRLFCSIFLLAVWLGGGSGLDAEIITGHPQLDYAIRQFDSNHTILIDVNDSPGPVNKKILGSGLIGDAMSLDDGFMNYGGGIYDPTGKRLVSEVVNLAQGAGVTMFRFPGGSGADIYDWKRTYWEGRTDFLFGIDEFMAACEAVGAEPVYTVSYFTGTVEDAADLVEYLNSPADGSNPNGGIDWAQVRADKGHAAPYGVIYFELGNEVYNGRHSNGGVQAVIAPEAYALDYLAYRQAMKAVDPNIRLGLSLDTMERNRVMFRLLQGQIDFGSGHMYPNPGFEPDVITGLDPRAIFLTTYSRPYALDIPMLHKIESVYQQETGLTNLPIFVTEYNTDFRQNDPIPYRHSLGAALLMADMVHLFLLPENRVAAAHQHYFANEYWGMIKSGTPYRGHDYNEPILYAKRPTFYVYELYHKNFGDVLLNPHVTSSLFQVEDWLFAGIKATSEVFLNEPNDPNPQGVESPMIPFLSVNASLSKDGNNLYLMVVNRHPDAHITATIDIRNFAPLTSGHAWILNGSVGVTESFDVVNEDNPYIVRLKHKKVYIPEGAAVFPYRFERHSLTSIILSRNNLDHLWTQNDLDQIFRLEGLNGVVYTYNPDGTVIIETPNDLFWRYRLFNTEDGVMMWGRDVQGVEYEYNGDGTYSGRTPVGETRLYDLNFTLIGVVDASGTQFTFNPDGTLTGTAGDGIVYHYSADWRLLDTTDPQGNANYYDAQGNIVRRVDAQGTAFVFNADGTITGTETDGTVTLYNAQWIPLTIVASDGKPVLTTEPDGSVCDWQSDGSRRCRSADGSAREYNFNNTLTAVYTSEGRPVMIRDAGGQITYFNEDGTIRQTVDSAGNVFVFNFDGTITGILINGYTVLFSSVWQVISVTPPP